VCYFFKNYDVASLTLSRTERKVFGICDYNCMIKKLSLEGSLLWLLLLN